MFRRVILGVALFAMLAGTSWALEGTPQSRSRQAERCLEATPPREMILDATDRNKMHLKGRGDGALY